MRSIIGAPAAAILLLLISRPAAADKPATVVAESQVSIATVEAVDKDTREVTLRREDGDRLTFKAGPEVRNFDQIQVGDKVTATHYQGLAIFVAPPGATPEMSETESAWRAPLGDKPGGRYTRSVNISATVEAVDLATRNVTLRGPKGNRVTLTVGKHVANLEEVKVGDMVSAGYTESVDIAVTKP